MEKEQILDYREREQRLVEDLLRKSQEATKLSILDFYPEYAWLRSTLYCADLPTRFSAIDPKARAIPIWVTLPYSGVLIVGVEPLTDEGTFRQWYGLGVEELADLIKKKKVVVRVNNPLELYDGLHYLDPILERHPPTLARSEAFSIAMIGKSGLESTRHETQGILDKLSARPLNFAVRWRIPETTFTGASITLFERLHTLGQSELVNSLVSQSGGNFHSLIAQVRRYYLLLAAPVFRSLDGIHALAKDRLLPHPRETASQQFPLDVGRFLVQRLELIRPRTFEHALDIYPDYERARQCLFKLDTLLDESPSMRDLEDRTSELERSWQDVLEIARGAERFATITKSVGVVGSIASSFFGLPGILASLGFTCLSLDRVAKPLGETAAKLGKQSHVVEIYDFGKYVAKWKAQRLWAAETG